MTRPIPTVELRGRFLLCEAALAQTERLLPTYRGPDGDHEGLVFLAGRELPDGPTLLTTAIAPDCQHGPGGVWADHATVGRATRAARAVGLGLLAQVHSHPRAWTTHSTGDDEMIVMPFEGMLSIVVGHYGQFGMRPLANAGVHQFQDGTWRLCSTASIATGITTVPAAIDLR
jgi:hypothetical protein